MKKIFLTYLIVLAVLISCFSVFSLNSVAAETDIVKDGLYAWYDGSNNANGKQDKNATVWKDLSGNGNHMYVRIDNDNYWNDGAYHVKNTSNYFPQSLVKLMNSNAYTVEFVAGNLDHTATDWITFIASENDELSLFVRVEYGNLEYKYNDQNDDRPIALNGFDLFDNSTVSVTFNFTSEGTGKCVVYVDGNKIAEGVPVCTNIIDRFFFGNEDSRRAWSGDIHSFRFYDRALSVDEVKQNSDSDNAKYRSGKSYSPAKQYTEKDEEIFIPGKNYKNNVVKLDEKFSLVDVYSGFEKPSYGDHTGVRLTVSNTNEATIDIYYKQYARMLGADAVDMADVKYVVFKLNATECFFGGSRMVVMSGGNCHDWRNYSYSGYASELPNCVDDVEYMVFEPENCSGALSKIKLAFTEFSDVADIYLYEVAFFETEDEMSAYLNGDYEGSDDVDGQNKNDEKSSWIVIAVVSVVAVVVVCAVIIVLVKRKGNKKQS